MLKIVAPFRYRADRPYDECRDYWLEHHKDAVAACLPECRRYVQDVSVPVRGRRWPFDAVAEIWFEDMAAIRRSFEGELAERLREDERVFSPGGDQSAWLIVQERLVFDRGQSRLNI